MLHRLYAWTLAQAEKPNAIWVLFFVAFLESSVFPIPPDTICLAGSVLGGVLGYVLGAFFYDQIGGPILSALGKAGAMEEFNHRFNDLGFWPVLVAGITPFPYNVITIMSGWTGLSFTTFLLTSIIARGLRFFLVAVLLWKFGAPIRIFIEKRLGLLFTIFIVLLVGAFYGVKFL